MKSENNKYRFLPWEQLDRALDKFSEWMFLTAEAAASLSGIPNLIFLFLGVMLFGKRMEASTPKEFSRWHKLRKKDENEKTIDETFELTKIDYGLQMHPPSRSKLTYREGMVAFFLSLAYSIYKIINGNLI